MKKKHKWTLITTFIIVKVVVVMAVLLKLQYDRQNSSRVKEKVKSNNINIKSIITNTYGKGAPNSRLDILTPNELDQDNKLPVIFWMHGGGFIAGDKQYKNPLLSKIAEQGYIVVNINY